MVSRSPSLGRHGGRKRRVTWSSQELSDDPCFFQKQKRGGRRAVEKAGPWKARKTKSRFSSLPTALGNRAQPARFPLFPQPRLLLVFLPASQLTWWAKLDDQSGPN